MELVVKYGKIAAAVTAIIMLLSWAAAATAVTVRFYDRWEEIDELLSDENIQELNTMKAQVQYLYEIQHPPEDD